MGTLYVCDQWDIENTLWREKSHAATGRGLWRRFGEARGCVAIPIHCDLRLEINWESRLDTSPLADLGPDDLQSLELMQHSPTAPISALTGLRQLSLGATDSDLFHIRNLTSLESLDLSGGSEIQGEGLMYLKNMKKLQWLNFSCFDFDEEHLVHLQELTSLKGLNLTGIRIGDEGLSYLGSLVSLRHLRFSSNEITGEELIHLRNLEALEFLSVSAPEMGDAGIPHLLKLESLQVLALSASSITDEGLLQLASLKSLKTLGILMGSNQKVTEGGVEKLKQLLPDLEIDHSYF